MKSESVIRHRSLIHTLICGLMIMELSLARGGPRCDFRFKKGRPFRWNGRPIS